MLRMIFWFAVLAAVAALAAWLADRPGHIAINWLGYHIETSLAVAMLAILAVLAVLWLLWSLLRRLLHTPGAIVGYVRGRRRRRGQQALSRGIVAVAAGDRDAARRQADVAARLLPGDPLARLLEAQTAQLRGDHRRVERVFADMLAEPETEVVALRGLYARALQSGDEARARELAERAYRRQPGLDWASAAVLKSRAAESDWPAVLAVLEARRRAGLITDDTVKSKRAVVLTAQALEAEKTDAAAALDLAGKALKLDPGLVPAAALLARVHFAQSSLRRGLKVIEKTWPVHPHPDLAEAYAHARPGDSAQDRLARIRELLKASPGGEEGAVALARVAIEARDWTTARAALAPYTDGRPRARVCVLMAEIAGAGVCADGRNRRRRARRQGPGTRMAGAGGERTARPGLGGRRVRIGSLVAGVAGQRRARCVRLEGAAGKSRVYAAEPGTGGAAAAGDRGAGPAAAGAIRYAATRRSAPDARGGTQAAGRADARARGQARAGGKARQRA